MKTIEGYWLITPDDLVWRPSNLMRIPNADYLERTGSEILGARLWRLPPRSANTLHKHIRSEEFYFVLEGTGRIRVGDETVTVPRYGSVLVGPDQLRQVFNDTDSEVLWLIIGAPEEVEFLKGTKSQTDLSMFYPSDPTELPKELAGLIWPPKDAIPAGRRELPACVDSAVPSKTNTPDMSGESVTPDQIQGSCLCGGVHFSFSLPHVRFNYCLCESCRKTTGSSNAANVLIPTAQFRWEAGESLVSRFTDSTANPGFRRWFCSRCGGPVPRLNRTDEFMVIPAGLLDSRLSIRPERSIYWSERAEWLVAVDAIPKFVEGLDSSLRDEPLHAQLIRNSDSSAQL